MGKSSHYSVYVIGLSKDGRERYKVTDRLEARVLARTTKHTPADALPLSYIVASMQS